MTTQLTAPGAVAAPPPSGNRFSKAERAALGWALLSFALTLLLVLVAHNARHGAVDSARTTPEVARFSKKNSPAASVVTNCSPVSSTRSPSASR